MSVLALRGYQEEAIIDVRAAMRRERRVLLTSPTGSGKTVLTAHMIRQAVQKRLRIWFLVHRKELLDQTSRALWTLGVQHGQIAGGRTMTAESVHVASVLALAKRAGKLTQPDLIIIDEAHHATAASYLKILQHCPGAWVIGLTATPERSDGRGLGDVFGELVEGPSVDWLIDEGYLAPYRVVCPPSTIDLSGVRSRGGDYARGELEAVVDQKAIVGNAVHHYREHVHPGTCLVYCVSRAHARHVEAAYRTAGIDARYCAGDTPKDERNEIIDGLRVGSPPVVVSVDLFGEGLDAPGLNAVQLLRPTQSLGLHLQQLGRGLRPDYADGFDLSTRQGRRAAIAAGPKPRAIILDHVGNTGVTLGGRFLLKHGFPDDEREWTLEATRRKKKSEADDAGPAMRVCDQCFGPYHMYKQRCPHCGAGAPISRRSDPEEVDGALQEVDPKMVRRQMRRQEGQAQTLEELVALAKSRGYKAAWAGIRHASRTGEDRTKCIKEAQKLWRQEAMSA